MSAVENGGPAFPVDDVRTHDGMGLREGSSGMSLRDYFAVHADQPGISEMVAQAGLVWSAGQVWSGPSASLGSFDQWWATIPLADRLRISAEVRYSMADAMLLARGGRA